MQNLVLRAAARAGWGCRELEAHDLALDRFQRAFPRDVHNAKFLAAFETVAKRSGRLADLIGLYRSQAPEAKNPLRPNQAFAGHDLRAE